MPQGICRLCLAHAELRESHLIPRAIYKLLRSPADSHPNQVLITEEEKVRTQQQVKDYVFCDRCEQLLNDRGERWVIEHAWRSVSDFRILDALSVTKPSAAAPGFAAYDGAAAGLDMAQIVHFGAGIFWRSAAYQWSPVERRTPPRLELGPYEEELRRSVLGVSSFPDNAAMVVSVSSDKSILRNERFTVPHLDGRERGYRRYSFVVPGLYFELLFGKVLPPAARELCIRRSGLIFVSDAKEEQLLFDFWKLQHKSPALPPVKPKR